MKGNKNKSHDSQETGQPPREKTPWELAQEQSNASSINNQNSSTKKNPQKNKQGTVVKKRRHPVWTLLILIFSVILFWTIYLISPLAKVHSVVVTGIRQTSESELTNQLGIVPQETIWQVLASQSKINQQVKSTLPKVSSLKIMVQGINTLVVEVVENPAVARYASQGKSFEILADATSIEVSSLQTSQDYPLLKDFTDQSKVETLAKQLAMVEPNVLAMVSEITYSKSGTNANAIRMDMKDGRVVKADLTNLGSKLNYYPQIQKEIGNQKGIIDMEIGVYFTPNQ
ncbi:cell division protein FtsQ/DivIB [Granulicatella seriolae]|uniref:FtsQ-type POTRA domain-containing protein n=1 Tax=Granulicatella seriolae TaxID=2967226 RepID=A0ABT1WNJ4_9LACT|nr:cell division protein FtsQ/DivIB [Granulicatella seriolae]